MSEEVPQIHGFKYKYKNFEQQRHFIHALSKVYGCEEYPSVRSAYKVKRLCDALQKEFKTYSEMREKITEKEKMEELHDIEVDIKWDKLTEDEVSCIAKVSPADLLTIETLADINFS